MRIDPYSICSVFINSLYNENSLGVATGFFYKEGEDIFLVSNWHVFSGRNPSTGQAKNANGAVPNRMSITYHNKRDPSKIHNIIFLIESDNVTMWVQHTLGQQIDVAVMNWNCILKQLNKDQLSGLNIDPFCINEAPNTDNMAMPMGADVFILGYPYGITNIGALPIWKRASIATEFNININNLPCFLVDTATREGMSGAPVIRRSFNGYTDTDGNSKVGPGEYSKFIGIYSGRYIGGVDEAQLGIIWREALIREIAKSPARGSYELLSTSG